MPQNQPQKTSFSFMDFYKKAKERDVQWSLVGEPGLPARPEFIEEMQKYLTSQLEAIKQSRTLLEQGNIDGAATYELNGMLPVEGYGDPQGDKEYRIRIANVFNALYKIPAEYQLTPENILFTAGATGSLSALTQIINKDDWVLVPVPMHVWHDGPKIYPMPVSETGFTADLLEQYLSKAQSEGKHIAEIRLCDPHNPMGYATSRDTWEEVATILRKAEYSHINVTIDEAYAEVSFTGHTSLLEVAPDLKNRITIIRTAGKGFSVTGNRPALVIASPERINQIMIPNTDTYFKVPPLIQAGYTSVLEWYKDNSASHHEEMRKFYQAQVLLVKDLAEGIGVAYKSDSYNPNIFYALLDLSILKNIPLSENACSILGYNYVEGTPHLIETDKEAAAYLLAKHNIALFPLSYYQHDADKFILRVTCGRGPKEMTRIMGEVEKAVAAAKEYHAADASLSPPVLVANNHTSSSQTPPLEAKTIL